MSTASSSKNQNGIEQLLKDVGLEDKLPVFISQKITPDVIKDLNEDDFNKIGVEHIGDRKRLRKAAAAQKGGKKRKISMKGDTPKPDPPKPGTPKPDTPKPDTPKPSIRQKKNSLKGHFGWMHKGKDGKFHRKTVNTEGGWLKCKEIPRSASLNELKKTAIKLFFLNETSPLGIPNITYMKKYLANYKGTPLPKQIDGKPFTYENYHGSCKGQVRIYLYTEKKNYKKVSKTPGQEEVELMDQSAAQELNPASKVSASTVHLNEEVAGDSHQVVNRLDYIQPATLQLMGCEQHSGSSLKFYCQTCSVPICMECTIIEHRVPEHKHIYLDEAAKNARNSLNATLIKVKKRLEYCKESEASVRKVKENMKDSKDKAVLDAKAHTEDLVEKIRENGKDLLKSLEDSYEKKSIVLDSQINGIKQVITEVKSSIESSLKLLEKGTDAGLMSIHKKTQEILESLIDEEIQADPRVNHHLHYSPDQGFANGKQGSVISLLLQTTNKGGSVAKVMDRSSLIVHWEQLCQKLVKYLLLISTTTESKCLTSMDSTKDSSPLIVRAMKFRLTVWQ